MNDIHPVVIIITTYLRTDLAVRTIKGLKENLKYPRFSFHIADDGSGPDHIQILKDAIGPDYPVTVTDAQRRGVGVSMNLALQKAWETSHIVLLMEDDWLLSRPLDLHRHVNVLWNHRDTYGMIRMGWLSTGTKATLVGLDGHCYWELEKGSHQYIYSGQVSLRTKSFYDYYGPHIEGVNPKMQEIHYCGKFNATPEGPKILWPDEFAAWGPFVHIGHESIGNTEPMGV